MTTLQKDESGKCNEGKISHFFYINLDHRIDRREHIEQQFQRMELHESSEEGGGRSGSRDSPPLYPSTMRYRLSEHNLLWIKDSMTPFILRKDPLDVVDPT